MTHLVRLVRENVRLLEQGRALIASLADGLYAKPAPALGLSGAGSHFRHCVDFYARFLAGIADGRLDYDGREREARVEHDPARALERIDLLIGTLEDLAASAHPARSRALEVKAEAASSARADSWATSSIERELQFLCSHTVHHYALIAVVLRSHGCEPGAEFGVAPSTLRYWKEGAGACAP